MKTCKIIPHLHKHRIEKKKLNVLFYISARLKKIPTTNDVYIYSSFSLLIPPPIVEWYMNDIDKS